MMFYGKCTSGEYNVETLEQLRTRALWGGGGGWVEGPGMCSVIFHIQLTL